MKYLLYAFLLVSFCAVSSVNYDQNEEELDAINEIKKNDHVSKQKKFLLKSFESGDIQERQRLINYIFNEGYDKRNYPTNMTVKLGLNLNKIDIDEHKSTLETDVRLIMMWPDKRLAWDTRKFNVGLLRVRPGDIYHPDMTLQNSAASFESDMMKCHGTNKLVYPNGDVLWLLPCHLSAHCNLTINADPYAPQKCMLKFLSWTFDGLSMDLQIFNNQTEADISNLWDTSQWTLISNNVKRDVTIYSCCAELYCTNCFTVSITYYLTIQRKSNS